MISGWHGRDGRMKEIFLVKGMQLDLDVKNKDELFGAMTDILVENKKVKNKRKFMKALYKRENVGVTGMENEIAIPHGKSASVVEPTVLFCKLKNPIPYESLIGDRVSKVFMIAVPDKSDNEHLKIISSLARNMMHQEFIDGLDNVQSADQFIKLFSKEEEQV